MHRSSSPKGTNISTGERLANYVKHFNVEAYLASYTLSETISANNTEWQKGLATMYHEVFSTHPAGERLLDVGSGPTLWHVMSASAKYKSIILSDPLPQNRDMLQMYMNDVRQDSRWTEHFKLTARLEGNEEKWPEVGRRLRSCISDVIWCDVNDDNPLGEERATDLYDCVMSSLCLNRACTDVPSYTKAVQHLVSLAKPGASVVISGVLENSFYEFDRSRFPQMNVTRDVLEDIFKAVGCTVIKSYSCDTVDECGDGTATFVIEGRKP